MTYYKFFRVTSLEHLSVAEFSGEKARPKIYENGHKNVLDLVLNVKIWAPFKKVNYIRIQCYQNMVLRKVNLPFLYFSMKKSMLTHH